MEEGEKHPRQRVLTVVVPPASPDAMSRRRPMLRGRREAVASRRDFLRRAGIAVALGGVGVAIGFIGKNRWEEWIRKFYATEIAETKKTLANYRTGYVCEGEIVVPKSVTIRTSTDAPAAGLNNIVRGGGAGEHEPVRLSGKVFLVEGDDIEPGAADGKLWVVWTENYSLHFASLHAINEDLKESGGSLIDPSKLIFGTFRKTTDGAFQLVNPERGAIPLNFPNLD